MFLFSQGVNPIKMPHPHDLSKLSPSNVTSGAGSPVDCELCEDREFSVEGVLGSLVRLLSSLSVLVWLVGWFWFVVWD